MNEAYLNTFNNTTSIVTNAGDVRAPNMTLSSTAKILMYICFIVIFLLGTVGNVIVIYAIGAKYRVVRGYNLHIISLSIADLYTSIFLPVVTIHDLLTNLEAWHLGVIGCKILPAMNHVTMLVSSFMLVIISVSRLRVIRSARAIHISRKRCLIEISCAWIIAFFIVSPYMFVHKYNRQKETCYDDWDTTDTRQDSIRRLIYFSVYECFACFIPAIIMVVVYLQSISKLRSHHIPGNHACLERNRKHKNMQIIKMFGLIVFVFFTLTTPYMVSVFVVIYYMAYDKDFYTQHIELFFNLSYALFILAGFNCCVNPFIYAGMHQDVRKFFQGLATRKERHGTELLKDSEVNRRSFTDFRTRCVSLQSSQEEN
ncbi:C-C chemokine receptor type 1-like [Hydractinia symbiolongicarpus]|uniref:C-C chemokine receptor type 1-like n=1 Tax=Hydractinia symbiolongicarpus TaxID=13093 RepID=UPI00254B8C1E|nr:C-C chemokine receptor type 1-like [Hydractinia symbiolongicarpus]XP_057303401.1 C-C chemokine receptor type 1-like [Hydractinia symbiolongicarpus]XP_057303402.1 C-C chemokine receptor type 1-like [Hydractinia symbiolongicarpus]